MTQRHADGMPPRASSPASTGAVVDAACAGQRLDVFLVERLGAGSRARARRALERGKVMVDGELVGREHAGMRVRAGMEVTLDWNRPQSGRRVTRARAALQRRGVRVLYEDRHQLALDKPAGLLADAATHRQRQTHTTLRDLANAWLRPQGKTARIVHRIDRDTSGVVLVAKTDEAEAALRAQFRHYRTERRYLAVVWGIPSRQAGVWRHTVRWDRRARKLVPCPAGHRDAREAIASWRRVATVGDDMAVLLVRLGTGRRNQIRAQAALEGHPVVGDCLYGGVPARAQPVQRQALHAWSLTWTHPVAWSAPARAGPPQGAAPAATMCVVAPIPADLSVLLRRAFAGPRLPASPDELLDPPAPVLLP